MMIICDDTEYVWAQKYRPKTIDDCILPEHTKSMIKKHIDSGEIPHFLFIGGPGCGKTTAAYAIANDIGCDVLYVNASLENGIDMLRTTFQSFASTVSLSDSGPKIIIGDEADGLSGAAQGGLKSLQEQFSKNCRFIFTANHRHKIIDPIQSRCTVVNFAIGNADKSKLAAEFFRRVKKILEQEKIEYDAKIVAELIKINFPDFRKTLNELQRYSTTGKIDAGILINLTDDAFKELITGLKQKNFATIRKWIAKNSDIEDTVIYRMLFDKASTIFTSQSIPQLILILADYGYKSGFVVDKEVNTVAAMVEIMSSCTFQ